MPDQIIRIIPECYADTTLAQFFIKDPNPVDHEQGIHNVARAMKEAGEFDAIVVGIIDNDKTNTPTYFDSFETIDDTQYLTLKKHSTATQFIIVIKPKAVEQFFLDNAAEVSIRVEDYGFPGDVRKLRKLTKKESIKSNPDFQRLLSDLHTRQAPGFLTLERILNDLITT
ncbi:hypothetical protein [Spirosoma foliorum]|uniref:Uncharacterized protein n=1 Tax=Spirosoma foliorum TaxID=2710596 RepID=A0A7G5H4Q4_9BACT|nr:hypothetical protein [Spirosoma foliorum]QMW06096.1 hypothetical protein H3H32_14965 [Spirosoma foliorum]